MVGHEKVLNDLKALAERGELGHGYIFFGPSMIGKRTFAREFAEYLESAAPNSSEGNNVTRVLSDFLLIDLMSSTNASGTATNAGSIGIDAVREIKNFLWQKPNTSARRTLVIDDAELLTTEAQNALLKITEEPPVSSLLILITSDIDSILPTITSRLPKIYFGTLATSEIKKWLKNDEIAKRAMGKPGLAWRLLNDEDFQEQLALAERFLRSSVATRRDVIKKIIEPEEFNFRNFLDALILQIVWREAGVTGRVGAVSAADAPLWHRVLRLYDREANFSLNPRLQLEALAG